jgi:hypothetical protein
VIVFQTRVSAAIGEVRVCEATGAPATVEVGHSVGASPLACPAQNHRQENRKLSHATPQS